MKTTPPTFILGERVGGYDDLQRYFGQAVAEEGEESYQPVIAIFAVAALMALAFSRAAFGSVLTSRTGEWFIAISMCVRRRQ